MSTIHTTIHDVQPGRSPKGPSGIVASSAVAAVALVAVLAGSALHFGGLGDWAVLIALASLAVVGVFSLFGAAVGLLHFADDRTHVDLVRVYAENLPEGLQILSADGTELYANSAFKRLVEDAAQTVSAQASGNSTAGTHGQLEHLLNREPQAAEAYFRLSRAAERGLAAEELVHLGRRGQWLQISTQPIESARASLNAGRKPFRALKDVTCWRVRDVTGERLRSDQVQRQLEYGMEYLDSVPLGFLSSGPDGVVDHMNGTLARWLGLDQARIAGGDVKLGDLIAGEAAALLAVSPDEMAPRATQEPAAGDVPLVSQANGDEMVQVPIRLDVDLVQKNGSRLPVRLIHQKARLDSGPDGRAKTLVLNRAPGEILDESSGTAEIRLARFFQSAPFGIATLDRQGRIVNANGTFARMFSDARRGGIISTARILERIADDDSRALVDGALRAALEGRAAVAPVDASFGPGGERSRRFYLGSIGNAGDPQASDADGEEVVILYVVDTTEQKALELKFAQSQKMEAIGQLAGGIAHDFNNVLTAIIGFSDLLLQNQRPTDPAYNDIVNIKQNADRAAGLVRQLLAFSRRQTLQAEVLSLAEVISDFSFMLSRYITEKVNLKLVHGRDLWLVKADNTQLEQVLMNLAVNARDAMPEGGTLTIRTRNVGERESAKFVQFGMEPSEYVLCEVEDTGVGMTPDVMAKIFEPFFSTKDVGKGTGLGLSTVYGIVKQTGGFIFADSAPGKGTTFRVFLPRHSAGQGELEAQVKADRKEKDRPRDLTGTGRVLLVEDEDAVRSFAKRALERQGYEVLEAATGAEALEVMDGVADQVDVVVSDVVMPEMDGPTLLKLLRKRNPDIKIIFISGYPEDAFKKNLPEGEVFGFLAKPFRLPQLAAKVKETIES